MSGRGFGISSTEVNFFCKCLMKGHYSTKQGLNNYSLRSQSPSITRPDVSDCVGALRLQRLATGATIRCRRGGTRSKNPAVSVAKPGISNITPASASSNPSATSSAGVSPEAIFAWARNIIAMPCQRIIAKPITAVVTTKNTVGNAPTTPPTLIISQSSVSTSSINPIKTGKEDPYINQIKARSSAPELLYMGAEAKKFNSDRDRGRYQE